MLGNISLITIMTLSVSAFGFLSNMLMARSYGVGWEYDAYLYALSTPIFIAALINSLYMYLLVPKLVLIDKENYRNTIIELIKISILISIPFIVISVFPDLFTAYLHKYDNLHNEIIRRLISIAWLIGGIQIYLAAINAILNSQKKYYSSIFLSYIPYFGIIGAIILSNYSLGNISYPLYGMFIGLISALLLGLKLIKFKFNDINLYRLSVNFSIFDSVNTFISSFLVMNIFSIYAVIDAYIAPTFGVGYLAVLGYSQRIIIGIGNIAVVGLLTVMGANFPEVYASKGISALGKEVKRIFSLVAVFSSIIGIILYLFIDVIIDIIFGVKSITIHEKNLLIQLNQYMIPGMIAMLTSSILMRALFIFKEISLSLITIGLGWPIIYSLSIVILKSYGIKSFGIGYSLSWFFVLAIILAVLYYKITDDK